MLAGRNGCMSRPTASSLLFLCVANSARSQMAEGLARARFGERVSVQSAGSHPGTVHRHAVVVLAEVGVDISGYQSKHVETIDPASVGTVITLCAEAVCPLFLGHARRLAWPLPDPAGSGGTEAEQLARFRAARDQIDRHLAQFVR
jgi:arsenate reductase